jgi:hypothetical protein
MSNSVFPSNPKLTERAENEAANYFSYYYPQEEDDSAESLLPLQRKSLTEIGIDE